jgi:hypothetical protein
MAGPHPGLCEKSAASIGSNSSAPSGDFSEIEATIHRLCDARGDEDGNRAAAIQINDRHSSNSSDISNPRTFS